MSIETPLILQSVEYLNEAGTKIMAFKGNLGIPVINQKYSSQLYILLFELQRVFSRHCERAKKLAVGWGSERGYKYKKRIPLYNNYRTFRTVSTECICRP